MFSNFFRHVINKTLVVTLTRADFNRHRTIYEKASQRIRTTVVDSKQQYSKKDQKTLR